LTLSIGDTDFSTRWSLLKGYFSCHIEKGERISKIRIKRGEGGCGNAAFGSTSFAMTQEAAKIMPRLFEK
jgi:hypothetical protein